MVRWQDRHKKPPPKSPGVLFQKGEEDPGGIWLTLVYLKVGNGSLNK